MDKPQGKWTAAENSDPMNDQEKEAYRHMQSVVFKELGKASHLPRTVVMEEAAETDFTTPQGRKARSARNLEFLREMNEDCPPGLIQEIAGKIKNMRTILTHKSFNFLPIVDSCVLLSNRALKKAGVTFNGSTNESHNADETNFGNTNFVFTRPLFNNPADTIEGGNKIFIPVSDKMLSDYAWLSFHDWINYGSKDAVGARDDYAGNLLANEKRQSFIYDFFQGKDDIAQATAYKVYEGLKTAMLIFADDNARYGFDEEKAGQFVKRGLASERYRSSALFRDNTLSKPIEELELSNKQRAFLEDIHNPDRNAFVHDAMHSTLTAMSQIAEVKVPHSIPLDGAACVYEPVTFAPWELARFTSDPTRQHPLRFKDPLPTHEVIVPKSHYPAAQLVGPG